MIDERLQRQLLHQNGSATTARLVAQMTPLVEVRKYDRAERLYAQGDNEGDSGYFLWMVLSGTGVTLRRNEHRLMLVPPERNASASSL